MVEPSDEKLNPTVAHRKGNEVIDEVVFLAINQGLSLMRSPVEDEQPGPPFNQRG